MRIAVLISGICLCISQAPSLAKDKRASSAIARPFLIVPGYSIGKIILGQTRETVLRKMPPPSSTLRRNIDLEDKSGKKISVNVTQDIWKRRVSPKEKKKRDSYLFDEFHAVYFDNKVIQISVSITNYVTKDGLGVSSTFDAFARKFGKHKEYGFVLSGDSETPSGEGYAFMKRIWDFEQHGIAIDRAIFSSGDETYSVVEIFIHNTNQPYFECQYGI
jgi:hypothetical protein